MDSSWKVIKIEMDNIKSKVNIDYKLYIKKYALLIFSIMSLSIASSLLIFLDISVGAWDCLNVTISNLSNIKIGTITIIVNSSCVLIQFLILRKNFKLINLLQLLYLELVLIS